MPRTGIIHNVLVIAMTVADIKIYRLLYRKAAIVKVVHDLLPGLL